MLGGSGTMGQTLGTTSLAAAPQLLLLLTALPYVAVAGLGTWTLLCRYIAIRESHGLSWARSIWVVVLPNVVLTILLILLFTGLSIALVPFMAGGF
jgi:hypothetical protein